LVAYGRATLEHGPDEFTVPLKGSASLGLVKMDRKNRKIHLTYLPEAMPGEKA
jgi:hypothetical protein